MSAHHVTAPSLHATFLSLARWPIPGVLQEFRTTGAIELQPTQGAPGDELFRCRFDDNGLAPFTFDDRDSVLRSGLEFLMGFEMPVIAIHDSEKSVVVRVADPQDADAICLGDPIVHSASLRAGVDSRTMAEPPSASSAGRGGPDA